MSTQDDIDELTKPLREKITDLEKIIKLKQGWINKQGAKIAELKEELTSVRITTGNYASTMRECADELEREYLPMWTDNNKVIQRVIAKLRGLSQ